MQLWRDTPICPFLGSPFASAAVEADVIAAERTGAAVIRSRSAGLWSHHEAPVGVDVTTTLPNVIE
jgi:hypothetical protein